MKLKKGKSLCFFSAKGGVGKTINLINLAGIFQQLGKKVLIIDLDLYAGGVATILNVDNKKDIYSITREDLYSFASEFLYIIMTYPNFVKGENYRKEIVSRACICLIPNNFSDGAEFYFLGEKTNEKVSDSSSGCSNGCFLCNLLCFLPEDRRGLHHRR